MSRQNVGFDYRHSFKDDRNRTSRRYNWKPYNDNNCGRYRSFSTTRPYQNRSSYSSLDRSLIPGTEEFTNKKIRETSEKIKRIIAIQVPHACETESSNALHKTDVETPKLNCKSDKIYNVGEIHNKLLTHINTLSYKKKMKLIASKSSGLDELFHQIQQQTRLQVSKALRDLSSEPSPENSEVLNFIIPDFDIKLEELPHEIVQELSNCFCDGTSGISSIPPNQTNSDVHVKVEDCSNQYYAGQDFADLNLQELDGSIESFYSLGDNIHHKKEYASIATQTVEKGFFISTETPKSFSESVEHMLRIDREIERLTQIRQSLFVGKAHISFDDRGYRRPSIRKRRYRGSVACAKPKEYIQLFRPDYQLDLITEKVLELKIIQDCLVGACESGNLIFVNLPTGKLGEKVLICKSPLTCICYRQTKLNSNHEITINLYIGSFEPYLTCLNFHSKEVLYRTYLGDYLSISCISTQWEQIFMGCTNGNLLRYAIPKTKVELQEAVANSNILTIHPYDEGVRRVILIGAKCTPLCVRDAMSGLRMRTFDVDNPAIMPTIYSMAISRGIVYCGTAISDLVLYNFHDGTCNKNLTIPESQGITCVRIQEYLLFAACHNGNVYVFDTQTSCLKATLNGPGGAIISMRVVRNMIFVGTITFHLAAIAIPQHVLRNLPAQSG